MIKDAEKLGQVIDFKGMESCGKEWMDVDAMTEVDDKGYIFCEFKFADAPMPDGQEKALVRMVNALQSAGKETILLKCSHHDPVPNPINGKDAIVTCSYYRGKWRYNTGQDFTLEEVATAFIEQKIWRKK